MKKRTIVSLVALVFVFILFLSACARTPQTNEEPIAEDVVIELLHGQPEQPRVDAIQSIIDNFMAENPGITVQQVPVPEEGLWTKITTLMSAGELPALIEGGIDQMRLMNEEGVIDTKANATAIDAKGRDAFFKGALEILKAPGGSEFIGVPLSGWVAGVWYRKDWFAEKGLASPDTWENILEAARTFNEPDQRRFGIAFATEESDFTEQTFTQIALSNDAILFDDEGNPRFNSPEMKEAIEFFKELYQYGPQGSNGVTEVRDAFVGGNAAMAIYSTYIMPSLFEQNIAENIGFAVPTNRSAAGFGMISTMTISNMVDQPQRDAAAKFLTFMLNRESNITWLHMAPGGANPVIREIAEDEEYLSHELLKAFGETSSKVPETFNDLKMFGFQDGKTHPHMGRITAELIIPKALNAILVHGRDVVQEIDNAQKAMEAIVNQ